MLAFGIEFKYWFWRIASILALVLASIAALGNYVQANQIQELDKEVTTLRDELTRTEGLMEEAIDLMEEILAR
jgi:hypothetical protein